MNRKNVSPLRLHKPSGSAVATLNGRDHYLGPYNAHETRERYTASSPRITS